MQTTTALRLYGKRDLRLEAFTLPAMQDDEIPRGWSRTA